MKKQHASLHILAMTLLALFVLSACQTLPGGPGQTQQTGQTVEKGPKKDDWAFKPSDIASDRAFPGMTGAGVGKTMAPMTAMEAAPAGGNIGFSVGGAKDVGNFRENIKNDFLPIPTDITPEGLFYGYFFDTGEQKPCDKLFCPSYSSAVSADPLSKDQEYYLSVGLNSGIKESDFQRKKLNLVVVLDISGSMGSPFDEYYYDRFGNQVPVEDTEGAGKTKMEVASKSVAALLDHLKDDDRFGMVLFDDDAFLAKPMSRVGNTDMKAIKDHVLELMERGGTNMDAGMEMGTDLFKELTEADKNEYENRIIFITDAQPNRGDTSESGLVGMASKNADKGVFTTFIGVGVDFNTELIEAMTKIRGANYYSVHSAKEFEERMDKYFDYMVTPLVFDLNLALKAEGYEIEKVYGSPEADESTGEIMKVNTLFPSESAGGEVRGGIVLLKLKKTGESGRLELKVSYEDRNGKKTEVSDQVRLAESSADRYDNTGIRKAILLARYANVMKSWLMDEYRSGLRPIPVDCPPIIMREKSIIIPEPPFIPPCFPYPQLGQWERQSDPLRVSSHYKEIFQDFTGYFKAEMSALADNTLKQEVDTLEKLVEV